LNERVQSLRNAQQKHVGIARAVVNDADRQGRALTKEQQATVATNIALAEQYRDEADELQDIDRRIGKFANGTSSNAGKGLLARFKSYGWQPGSRAQIPFAEFKAATFDGDLEDLRPERREGVALGVDSRYLFPVFPSEAIDGTVTQVQVLRQKSRSLASGDAMMRELDAVTAKAETDSVRELTTVNVLQLANVSSGVPNVILASAQFESMVSQDLRLAYYSALDNYVHGELVNMSPSLVSEGSNLLEAFRHGMTVMRANGYNPNVAVVSPGDMTALDLMTQSLSEYVFSGLQQRFGLRFVESPILVDGESYLIDTSAVGRLYLGSVALASFEENAGSTNTTTVRLEGNVVFGPERDDAVLLVEPAGS
jgi:hypothetical protein